MAQFVACGLAYRPIPLPLAGGPRLGPAGEQLSCTKQRKQFGHELGVDDGCGLAIAEQMADLVYRVVPVHRNAGRQLDVLGINHQQRVGTHWPQPPHRGAQACDRAPRRGMWPQHRADPQPVYRPAFQRDQRDQPLARGRQLDGLLTSVNGELTEQVQ